MSQSARLAPRSLACAALVATLFSGCVYVQPPRVAVASDPEQSPEQILGTYLLFSSLSRDPEALPALVALYPPRAQLVTYALIAFHRERGAWPASATELETFLAASPANPPLPAGALDGFEIATKDNGDAAYSTREDRQRGRHFTLTSAYRVSFPASVSPYAGRDAVEFPPAPAGGSTLSFDLSIPASSLASPNAPTNTSSSAAPHTKKPAP